MTNFQFTVPKGQLISKQNCRAITSPKKQTKRTPPLIPDRPQVKRPPPSLQITSNFLVFYGLSHGTTIEQNGVAKNLIYSCYML